MPTTLQLIVPNRYLLLATTTTHVWGGQFDDRTDQLVSRPDLAKYF